MRKPRLRAWSRLPALALAVALPASVSAAVHPRGLVSGLVEDAPGIALPVPSGVPASDPGGSLPADAGVLLDAVRLGVPAAERAWPGYRALDIPLLLELRDGTALLVGASVAPQGFRPVVYGGMVVYVAPKGPLIGSYQRAYPFAGQVVTAVKAGDQTALDAAGGDGYPPLSWQAAMVVVAVHEHFHDFQDGAKFAPPDALQPVPEPTDVALAALENRALMRYLDGSADALRDFAALRLRRRALHPEASREEWTEIEEGTAKFVEMAAYAGILGKEAERTFLKADLAKAKDFATMAHQRGYPVGATGCLALDAMTPRAGALDWRAAVAAGKSPATLVAERLRLAPSEIAARVRRMTSIEDYRAVLAAARAQIDADAAHRREAAARFDAQPGVHVLFGFAGECINTGESLTLDNGTILFDPDYRLTCYGGQDRIVLQQVMLEIDHAYRFVLPPEATIELDGRPWTPVDGLGTFQSLRILWAQPNPDESLPERRIEFSLGSGKLRFEAKALVIVADER